MKYLLLMALLVSQSALADSGIVQKTIALEGANQPIEGQALIAVTLLNRALIRGTSAEIEALRRKQYSAWNDRLLAEKWLARHFDTEARENAGRALELARKWLKEGKYKGVTHYHTIGTKPYWANGKDPAVRIGSHVFYDNIN